MAIIKPTPLSRPTQIAITIITVLSFLIWLPTATLPFHWDGAAFVITPAYHFLTSNFASLIPRPADFAHPPTLSLLIAVIWKLTGITTLGPHLLNLPFIIIYLIASYAIARRILNNLQSYLVIILITFTPYFLTEIGITYLDLPAAAFANAAFAFSLYRRPKLTIFFLTLAIAFKHHALLLLPGILLTIYWQPHLKQPFSFTWHHPKLNHLTKALLIPTILIPLFIITTWLIYHYVQTGWWLSRPGLSTDTPRTFSQSLFFLTSIIQQAYFSQGRWWLTLIAIVSLYLSFHHRQLAIPKAIVMLSLNTFLACSYILTGVYIYRYGLILLPSYVVICLWCVHEFSLTTTHRHAIKVTLAIFIIALSMTLNNLYSNLPANPHYTPGDLNYRYEISLSQQAAHYLEHQYPQTSIYGNFPESYQLTQLYQGYLTQPLNFQPCSQFTPTQSAIIYSNLYTNRNSTCQQLINQYQPALLRSFKHGQLAIQLYQFTPS